MKKILLKIKTLYEYQEVEVDDTTELQRLENIAKAFLERENTREQMASISMRLYDYSDELRDEKLGDIKLAQEKTTLESGSRYPIVR